MRTNQSVQAAALLVYAALHMACGGGDAPEAGGAAQPGQSGAAAAATVLLGGCLEAAPGSNQFVLRAVRFEPGAVGDPHRSTTTTGGHGITEGAWVRVDGTDQDLKSYLGQRVVLKGEITDDGRNTIGTAGPQGLQLPSGDTSQAASREHYAEKQKKEMGRIARESMANGTAAMVRARAINGTGQRCVP